MLEVEPGSMPGTEKGWGKNPLIPPHCPHPPAPKLKCGETRGGRAGSQEKRDETPGEPHTEAHEEHCFPKTGFPQDTVRKRASFLMSTKGDRKTVTKREKVILNGNDLEWRKNPFFRDILTRISEPIVTTLGEGGRISDVLTRSVVVTAKRWFHFHEPNQSYVLQKQSLM